MNKASLEFGVSRHAPKEEGHDKDGKKGVDKEKAAEELEQRARFILQNLEAAPPGAVMALQPSNVDRAKTTRDLFADKLGELLGGRDDIEMLEIGKDRKEAEETLKHINEHREKKFIISDVRGTWLIGFRTDQRFIPAVNEWKEKVGPNEDLIGMAWSAHADEIPALAEELQAKGFAIGPEEIVPSRFQTTPEERALYMLKWLETMRKIGASRLSGRPLILEGISHNMPADFTLLVLLGEDISVESIDRVLGGKLRKPFERSSVRFDEDGNVEIAYRNIEKKYSAEEFQAILDGVRDKIDARRREWGLEPIQRYENHVE